MSDAETHERLVFPVSIIMERRTVMRGDWSWPDWRVHGVLTADSPQLPAHRQGTRIHADNDVERYLWTGLAICFHRDAAENYWQNLKGQQPSVFVVCRPEDDEDAASPQAPFLVTVDQYEAEAYMEGDDAVFAIPIPPEVYGPLERFVMDHYRPAEKRKRKRAKWSDTRDQNPPPRH